MQALNFYVIVEKIKEAPRQIAGMDIADANDKEIRYMKGRVISAGERVPVVKPGDIVRYDKHAGHGIPSDDDKVYFVMKGDDLVSICDEA